MEKRKPNPLLTDDYIEVLSSVDLSTMRLFGMIVSHKTFNNIEYEFEVIQRAHEDGCLDPIHLFRFKKVVKLIKETISIYSELGY